MFTEKEAVSQKASIRFDLVQEPIWSELGRTRDYLEGVLGEEFIVSVSPDTVVLHARSCECGPGVRGFDAALAALKDQADGVLLFLDYPRAEPEGWANRLGNTRTGVAVIGMLYQGFGAKWKVKPDRALFRIALHELGHILGLEHCGQEACIMKQGISTRNGYADLADAPISLADSFCPACRILFDASVTRSQAVHDPS